MNILKILGIVVAVHVVAFFLMFVNPGCRSTTQRTGAAEPLPAEEAAAPAATAPAPAPAVAVDTTPPPVVRYSPTRPGTAAAAALEGAPVTDVTPATTYTVVSGDSLWKIARKTGTTVAELQRANRLTSNSRLTVGQKLIVPGKAPSAAHAPGTGAGTYTVKPGDTLSSIAHRLGTTSAELMRINHLHSDYVRVGTELQLPPAAAPGAAAAPAATAAPGTPAAAGAAPVRKPDGSVIHVVKAGETLGAIARKYQVKLADLAVANNIADPRKIRPGQQLVIPGFTAVGGSTPAATANPPAAGPPAATPPAEAAPEGAPPPAATPPTDQDLDSGLKPQGSVPVIKVEGEGATANP